MQDELLQIPHAFLNTQIINSVLNIYTEKDWNTLYTPVDHLPIQVESFSPQHTIQVCGIGITESTEIPADYELSFNCIYILTDVNIGYVVEFIKGKCYGSVSENFQYFAMTLFFSKQNLSFWLKFSLWLSLRGSFCVVSDDIQGQSYGKTQHHIFLIPYIFTIVI